MVPEKGIKIAKNMQMAGILSFTFAVFFFLLNQIEFYEENHKVLFQPFFFSRVKICGNYIISSTVKIQFTEQEEKACAIRSNN